MYSYQVQVATDPEFKNLVVNTIVDDVTDYRIPKDLEHFEVYYWRVKTIDPLTGAESEWSTPCVFRIVAEDVTVEHTIDEPTEYPSHIIYGSNCFGLEHRFIRSYDKDCEIPDAVIGGGICDNKGDAVIGGGYCPGVCVPQWEGFEIEYLLTEDGRYILTEAGVPLIWEF